MSREQTSYLSQFLSTLLNGPQCIMTTIVLGRKTEGPPLNVHLTLRDRPKPVQEIPRYYDAERLLRYWYDGERTVRKLIILVSRLVFITKVILRLLRCKLVIFTVSHSKWNPFKNTNLYVISL